jgi:uncharacterized protein YjeT (DUF2065 family)
LTGITGGIMGLVVRGGVVEGNTNMPVLVEEVCDVLVVAVPAGAVVWVGGVVLTVEGAVVVAVPTGAVVWVGGVVLTVEGVVVVAVPTGAVFWLVVGLVVVVEPVGEVVVPEVEGVVVEVVGLIVDKEFRRAGSMV